MVKRELMGAENQPSLNDEIHFFELYRISALKIKEHKAL